MNIASSSSVLLSRFLLHIFRWCLLLTFCDLAIPTSLLLATDSRVQSRESLGTAKLMKDNIPLCSQIRRPASRLALLVFSDLEGA
jgi:hypothetical protein